MKIALLLGLWRAVLFIPGDEIPFNFEVLDENNTQVVYIINAEERIKIEEITFEGDSVFMQLPIFNAEIRARNNQAHLIGNYINHARKTNKKLKFEAFFGVDLRFKELSPKAEDVNFSGKYKVVFSGGTEDEYHAIGIFEQEKSRVTGTFLTSTGDYRFLEGIADGDSLKLSCFDGAHSFLFKAIKTNDGIEGVFHSGAHWKEPWSGVPQKNYELPDPYSLTFLKEGYQNLYFSFPDTDKKMLSLNDPRFKNKVTIVQILGSWCPNCMDESIFLTEFHNSYPQVEIVGLAFERSSDFEASSKAVLRMKEQLGITYPVLIAGRASKKEAGEALPMLNKVLSFPTTIFIDKKGEVRKIHTGFYGPATGDYYTIFKRDFFATVNSLLAE